MVPRKPLVLLFLAVSGVLAVLRAGACELVIEFEDVRSERVRVAGGEEFILTQGAMYSLYLAIEITDCISIDFDITIAGEAWDNESYVEGLQPMNKIQWREKGMSLVTNGIFRARSAGTHVVSITYKDDTLDNEQVTQIAFVIPGKEESDARS